jgi:hypothetical protein
MTNLPDDVDQLKAMLRDGSKKLDVLPIGGRRDGERESVQLGDDLSCQRSQSVLLLRASIPRAAQTDIE